MLVLQVKHTNKVSPVLNLTLLSKQHFDRLQTASSTTFLILWQIFRSSANKRQLELQIASQMSLIKAVNMKGPKVDTCVTADMIVYKSKMKMYQKYKPRHLNQSNSS